MKRLVLVLALLCAGCTGGYQVDRYTPRKAEVHVRVWLEIPRDQSGPRCLMHMYFDNGESLHTEIDMQACFLQLPLASKMPPEATQ